MIPFKILQALGALVYCGQTENLTQEERNQVLSLLKSRESVDEYHQGASLGKCPSAKKSKVSNVNHERKLKRPSSSIDSMSKSQLPAKMKKEDSSSTKVSSKQPFSHVQGDTNVAENTDNKTLNKLHLRQTYLN